MKNNKGTSTRIVFKAGLSWLDILLPFILFLFLAYLSEVWNWDNFIRRRFYLYFMPVMLLLYLYGQYRVTTYVLYEDRLIVKFPYRLFWNKTCIPVSEIESVAFKSINSLGIYSFFDIKVSGRKCKYHFSSTKDEKTEQLLLELGKMGVPVKKEKIFPS